MCICTFFIQETYPLYLQCSIISMVAQWCGCSHPHCGCNRLASIKRCVLGRRQSLVCDWGGGGTQHLSKLEIHQLWLQSHAQSTKIEERHHHSSFQGTQDLSWRDISFPYDLCAVRCVPNSKYIKSGYNPVHKVPKLRKGIAIVPPEAPRTFCDVIYPFCMIYVLSIVFQTQNTSTLATIPFTKFQNWGKASP